VQVYIEHDNLLHHEAMIQTHPHFFTYAEDGLTNRNGDIGS
jgi:hypothetical protein